MYTLTGSGTDFRGAHVVVITCSSCGYFEEHFARQRLTNSVRKCYRCGRRRQGLRPISCTNTPTDT